MGYTSPFAYPLCRREFRWGKILTRRGGRGLVPMPPELSSPGGGCKEPRPRGSAPCLRPSVPANQTADAKKIPPLFRLFVRPFPSACPALRACPRVYAAQSHDSKPADAGQELRPRFSIPIPKVISTYKSECRGAAWSCGVRIRERCGGTGTRYLI